MKTAHFTDGRAYPIGKVLCIGRNYAEHIRELGNERPEAPVVFIKPSSSVIGDGEAIVIPPWSRECHHEVELALLIGTTGKDIPADRAMRHIAGYGVGIDLTLRDVQGELKKKGLPWEIAKGFDTACPLSAFIDASRVPDPHSLRIRLAVNGEAAGRKHLDDDPPDPRHHQPHVGALHPGSRRRHPYRDAGGRRPYRFGRPAVGGNPGRGGAQRNGFLTARGAAAGAAPQAVPRSSGGFRPRCEGRRDPCLRWPPLPSEIARQTNLLALNAATEPAPRIGTKLDTRGRRRCGSWASAAHPAGRGPRSPPRRSLVQAPGRHAAARRP